MATINSNKAWNAYGKKDPYYGVLTHEEFKDENLNDENLQKFFDTGKKYVNHLFEIIEKHIVKDFKPSNILDFGCGTGRLSIPLAQRGKHVVGMDISPDMLEEGRKNADKFGVHNINFVISDDSMSALADQKFDLINSYIVLQHMNLDRGMQIIKRMLQILEPGGVGALQVAYLNKKPREKRLAAYLRYRVPLVNNVLNVLTGAPFNRPLMQMNSYNMNEVMGLMQENGVESSQFLFEKHGEFWSVMMVFQKPV
ncbi:class I SAM-dependent methyltransferase [Owenweeksia hongkongensis]|uniref:class I SAM-dependent methyltransferase n=1 Tax=Owenweeksia hongkongensis TaxID=253245 RepID=UPI003A8E0A4F